MQRRDRNTVTKRKKRSPGTGQASFALQRPGFTKVTWTSNTRLDLTPALAIEVTRLFEYPLQVKQGCQKEQEQKRQLVFRGDVGLFPGSYTVREQLE
jgi:hypothetical protein